MIWRDDDISVNTDLKRLESAYNKLDKYIIMHTVAVICTGFQARQDIINFIKPRNFDVQIHCWDHRYDLPDNIEQARIDIIRCLELLTRIFGHRPTTIYPPHNKTSPELEAIAKELNLKVSAEKISLSQYIRKNGSVKEGVINFHSWSDEEFELLDQATRIFATKYRPKSVL